MDALFITCIGVIVIIVMLLEFPADRPDSEAPADSGTKSKSGRR